MDRLQTLAGKFSCILVFILGFLTWPASGQTTLFQFTYEDVLTPVVNNTIGTPVFSSKGVGGLNFNATTPCEALKMYQGSYWSVGDVYQWKVNTSGFSGLVFSWCERGSNVLMGNFLVRVSADSVNWTTVIPAYVPNTVNTTQTTPTFPVACENAANVYIQIYKIDDPGSTGRSLRIDNAILTGVMETAPPVATFDPAPGSTSVLINVNPTITFNEPIRKTDGTPITNSDLPGLLNFSTNNASGTPVPYTATINEAKTLITIVPTSSLDFTQLYYLAIAPVEDFLGNEAGTQISTFTTMENIISSDATLSDLTVNGTTVTGFSPSVYTYSVGLPYATTAVPPVTATPTFGLATVAITPATNIPGSTTVLVTAQDGTTQLTYTVSFYLLPPSTEASLSTLKWLPVGAIQSIYVPSFSSTLYNYTVNIPEEVTGVSLSAIATNAYATMVVTPPIDLTGSPAERTGTVVVTAQDGVTSQTYSVLFNIDNALPFHFKEGFAAFPPTNWSYTGNISASTSNGIGIYAPGLSCPKFKWTAPTDGGTLVTPAYNTAGILVFYIRVLDNNLASQLHMYVEKSTNGGTDWTTIATDPMPLTASTAIWHQVTVPVNDNSPSVMLRFRGSAITGTTSQGLFYIDDVSLTMNPLADASLSDLKVGGVTVDGFSSSTHHYTNLLAPGTTQVPAVTATPSQPGATAVVTNAPSLPGMARVLVTAPNGADTSGYYVWIADSLSVPINFTAVQGAGGPVNLSWSDSNTDEQGFVIERKPSGGLFAHKGSAGAGAASKADQIPGLNPDNFIPADRFGAVTLTSGVKFANVVNYLGVPTPLYLDVYEPTGDTTLGRPIIIWIHGGGFRTDSYRTQGYIVDYCNRFAKRGYVCMSIDYRLRDASAMPNQADEFPALQDAARDANAAISWVKANAARYRIDPNLIFIAGGSAGGRTAQTVCQFDGPDTSAVYPPENMYVNTPWNKTGLVANATLWGGLEPEMRGWVYPYLQPTDIPTILVHGEADVTIFPQESIDLYDTLVSTGVSAELHLIPGATHSCLGHETEIAAWVATFFAQEWQKINARATFFQYRVKAFNANGYSGYSLTDGWPRLDSITETGCKAEISQNVPGNAWYVILPAGSPAPTPVQIKAGQNAAGVSLPSAFKGSVAITAGLTEYSSAITGLNSGTSYDIWFVAENALQQLQRAPEMVNFTTLAPSVPENLFVAAPAVTQTVCYNATNTITVGGSTGDFTVESGGNVTMIAGMRITYLPGTKVLPGGYMRGYITTNNTYCTPAAPGSMISLEPAMPQMMVPVLRPEFSVYPNPTKGRLTIRCNAAGAASGIRAELFDLRGDRMMGSEWEVNAGEMTLSLEGLRPGLYFLRIYGGSSVETIKVFKL